MNAGQLKALLRDVPDDLPVVMNHGGYTYKLVSFAATIDAEDNYGDYSIYFNDAEMYFCSKKSKVFRIN